ncbi:hypothetical protein [uncultured Draconibacterium sp.]|jgi:hypothetical protein|uniref:hypothetical protein n=1 Tax=uncultured Draconibacterium sp. TaxID=1573823 RepID=UPI00326115BE
MRKYIIISLFIIAAFVTKAQEGTSTFVSYLPSVPLGETADFSNNISPRGVDFEVQRFISEELSLGFNIAWNMFREKIPEESFDYKDLTITAVQFRYTNIVPVTVNMKKYFTNEGDYTPYLGFGVGTSYNEKRNDVGVFSVSEDKWLFNISPEIGMLYDLSYRNLLLVKLKYNYGFKSGDFPSQSFISLGVGIGLK